jgi:hypothetical protein
MSDQKQDDESALAWARETFDKAVQVIIDRGVLDGALIEAKPSWALPKKLVVGQVRETNETTGFNWVICGHLMPTDHLGATVAATPRDAARHFSLKWQLDATRTKDSSVADILIAKAEELYEIVEDDSLWLAQSEHDEAST